MIVRERFQPLVVGINTTVQITEQALGGFVCQTSGTITVTNSRGDIILNAFPVAGGATYSLPFYLGHNGGYITTAGGASGTAGV